LPIRGTGTFGNSVELVVEESSRGFDTGAVGDWRGVGLTSIRKRAEELGGSLMVLSASGEGSRVQVEVSH
jgi:signal transduction histidine kinase